METLFLVLQVLLNPVPPASDVLFLAGDTLAIVDAIDTTDAYIVYAPSDDIRTVPASLLPPCARVVGAAIRRSDGAVSLPWVKGQQAETGPWFHCSADDGDREIDHDRYCPAGGTPYRDPR